MSLSTIAKYKQTIIYGALLSALLFLLKWLERRFIIVDNVFEAYAGALAFFFTALGMWLALQISRSKTKPVVLEKQVYIRSNEFILNEYELTKLNLSKRELEVLQLMAKGLSNVEIADRLFLSLNTVKTHSSKLFDKMEVKRRTQAVEMAKSLSIIP